MKYKISFLVFAVFFSACTTTLIENPEIDFTTSEEVTITDGIKHSVPLDDILSGGPKMDGIPPIEDPKFTNTAEAEEYLKEDGVGLAVSFDGVERFYPFQILVWHEIVNDKVGSQDALITYCPLCGSGIVFNPNVEGEVVTFGTSGKLWNSNLLMYDRPTQSYWSQILGEAVYGEMTATKLALLPHQNMKWSDWKSSHPNGEVLSRDTGIYPESQYEREPYTGYSESERISFPIDNKSELFHPKTPIYGLEIDGTFKAYLADDLALGSYDDTVNGIKIIIDYDGKRVTFTREDTGEEVIPFFSFWFSWYAVHPETEVFAAN